eukprot:Hpha_TRINITY_DN18977_c0_g1::TRINITY_DN18977_c0_g1_i1::g.17563::m.17563
MVGREEEVRRASMAGKKDDDGRKRDRAELQESVGRERIQKETWFALGGLASVCHSNAVLISRRETLGAGRVLPRDVYTMDHLDPDSIYVEAIEFGDNDGDAVRLLRGRKGGIDLSINGQHRAQMRRIDYDPKKQKLRSKPYRMDIDKMPDIARRHMLSRLLAMCELAGVPHNLEEMNVTPPTAVLNARDTADKITAAESKAALAEKRTREAEFELEGLRQRTSVSLADVEGRLAKEGQAAAAASRRIQELEEQMLESARPKTPPAPPQDLAIELEQAREALVALHRQNEALAAENKSLRKSSRKRSGGGGDALTCAIAAFAGAALSASIHQPQSQPQPAAPREAIPYHHHPDPPLPTYRASDYGSSVPMVSTAPPPQAHYSPHYSPPRYHPTSASYPPPAP